MAKVSKVFSNILEKTANFWTQFLKLKKIWFILNCWRYIKGKWPYSVWRSDNFHRFWPKQFFLNLCSSKTRQWNRAEPFYGWKWYRGKKTYWTNWKRQNLRRLATCSMMCSGQCVANQQTPAQLQRWKLIWMTRTFSSLQQPEDT